jgi:hypothetical protein
LTAVILAVAAAFVVGFREEASPARICKEFRQLKNAGDPAAEALLGRVPAVPDAPVSEEEANRLQTDFFLRQPLEVLSVSSHQHGSDHFVLVTKGNVAAPTLPIQTRTGVETSQRTMSNPDLLVQVRDGKIYGLAARLHEDD